MDLWVEERNQDTHAVRFRVERVLFRGESEFQTVEIVETAAHGRMLLNDGLIMLTERDEFVYHEMIAHVPLLAHPGPRRVLVIGGGDGGTVRECLKHRDVEHVRLVEIDGLVVDACREHILRTAACLDDPRVQVTIADGVAFVAETAERYDVVLVDSTDPIGPAQPLFGREFYGNVRRVLTDQGIVVSQCENPWYEGPAQRALLDILGEVFPVVSLYNYYNLTYPGGMWSFSFASKGPRPDGELNPPRVEALGELQWWTPAIQRAAFALPAFQRRALGLET
ncbi:MAG TPA: polyamine aminopropyltransferase [Candidatus Krumholzibacteria bacterium]|nr:polyamine aminopropyltransferase [Candidatus Krumholzibacteria bacterium]HPD70344.1 polyamine aminopropyltransferase [Candidatus Krumholzibacteria bacterium]HRY39956.1 polyamine aminopropyltransferase [Candidatus Krumholzibacteria bacterium]